MRKSRLAMGQGAADVVIIVDGVVGTHSYGRERVADSLAFQHNIRNAARAAWPQHFAGFAEEREQGGVEIDLADESEQRLGGRAKSGGNFEAVDR